MKCAVRIQNTILAHNEEHWSEVVRNIRSLQAFDRRWRIYQGVVGIDDLFGPSSGQCSIGSSIPSLFKPALEGVPVGTREPRVPLSFCFCVLQLASMCRLRVW